MIVRNSLQMISKAVPFSSNMQLLFGYTHIICVLRNITFSPERIDFIIIKEQVSLLLWPSRIFHALFFTCHLACYDLSEVAFLSIFVVCLFNLGIRHYSVFLGGKIDRHTTGVDDFKKNIFFSNLVSLIDVCY